MAQSHKQQNTTHKLTYRERVIIENRYCTDRWTVAAIARELRRHRSSVLREIDGRPRWGRAKYTADIGQRRALHARARQGRRKKLATNSALYAYVRSALEIGWSPEQVQVRLPIEYPDTARMRISYEAVYQYVYAQIHRGGNGAVKPGCEDWRGYLPRRHTRRRKKGFRKVQKREREAKLPSIEERPAVVEIRQEVGHWEDDTVSSKKSTARVKSINELVTGVALFGRTRDGTAQACDRVLRRRLADVPDRYRKTLTRDRGTENIRYRNVEQQLNLSCFFAHPYCSHERGANENTNGLLRRYFPKGTDFSTITDRELALVEYRLNTRPRKRLGGLTPYEVFYQKTGVALDL